MIVRLDWSILQPCSVPKFLALRLLMFVLEFIQFILISNSAFEVCSFTQSPTSTDDADELVGRTFHSFLGEPSEKYDAADNSDDEIHVGELVNSQQVLRTVNSSLA